MSSSLIEAVKRGDIKQVKNLIETCGIDVDMTFGDDDYTSLYWAACNGHAGIVFYLLAQQKADVNKPVKWGSTPLHAAADRGHRDCVFHLCKGKAVINCQNYNHLDTPLHLAAYRGHLGVCKDLLSMGANITIQNRQGKTCLDEAHGQRKYDVYAFLLQHLQGNKQAFNISQATDDHYIESIRASKVKVMPNPKTISEPIIPYLTQTTSFMKSNMAKQPQESIDISKAEYLQNKLISNMLQTEKAKYFEKQSIQSIWRHNETSHEAHKNKEITDQICSHKEVNKTDSQYIAANPNGHGNIYSNNSNKNCDKIKPAENVLVSKHKPSSQCVSLNVDKRNSENITLPESYHKGSLPSSTSYNHPTQNKDQKYYIGQLNNALDHNSEISYLKTIESLQLQLTKARDHVAFLERKHTDLWTECEHYRGRVIDQEKRIAISLQYEKRYHKVIEENEQLKRKLKESDERSRSLAVLLYKYQTQSEHPPFSNVIQQPQNITMESITQKMENSSLLPKEPEKRQPASPSARSSTSSVDSFTRNLMSDTSNKRLAHSDLFSAILPIFHAMGDTFQRTMSESLRNKIRKTILWPNVISLDEIGKEWVCGEHFVLSEELPINRGQGHVEGSSSLVFRIESSNKCYVLKMMINLLDVSQTKHGTGQSFPLFLYRQFAPEYDIPTLLPPHPNLVPVLHYYNGSTISFRQFLPQCFPTEVNDSIEMANETTFIVMPEYPTTLGHFFDRKLRNNDEEGTKCIDEVFVIQKLYEILCAVSHLQDNKVVHRDIKADNVFLDHDLRAILGDFGFARRVQNSDGTPIPFVERSQVIAGNSSAWTPELAAMNRDGQDSLQNPISLEQIYSTTDSYAVGNMFFDLLCFKPQNPLRCSNPNIPECYSLELRNIIHLLKHTDVNYRLTARRGSVLTGLLLFGPQEEEVKSESECQIWHHARMMKLLVQRDSRKRTFEIQNSVLNVPTSIAANEDILERHFFVSVPAKEMWKEYQELLNLKTKY